MDTPWVRLHSLQGDKQRIKQKPQEHMPLSLPTITTGTPVTPDKSKPGAILRKSSFYLLLI